MNGIKIWNFSRFDVYKCVCSTLRRMSGGIATPVPKQVKTLSFARFNYRFFMGVVYVINCRKGAHRSSKLSYVVSLKNQRLQCQLFPLFFEIYCQKVISNLSWIDFQRPFLGVLVGSTSKCHGYPLHSNKTIRREPFSAVLVICAGFLYSWQKTRIDFKDDSDMMYFVSVRILLHHELWISSSLVSLSVWEKESSESSGIDVVINFNWFLACLNSYFSWRREPAGIYYLWMY